MATPSQTISVESRGNSTYQTGATYNVSHTIVPSENRYFLVGVSMLSVLGSSVVSLVFASIPLVFLRADVSASGLIRTELWGLVAPPIGVGTLAVTLSAALDSITGMRGLRGVHQTRPVTIVSGNNGVGAPVTTSVVVQNAGYLLDVLATDDASVTADAPQDEQWNLTGALGTGAGSGQGPATSAGILTQSWSGMGVASSWAQSLAGLRAATDDTIQLGLVSQPGFQTRQRAVGY